MISLSQLMTGVLCRARRCHGLVVIIGMSLAMQAFGQQEASEHEVKAAFIFNFAAYVEWPAEAFDGPQDAVVFGFLEADALADYLETAAAGRQINGRPIVIRRLDRRDSIDGIHVLFAGEVAAERDHERLREAVQQSVLTVTDNLAARPAESIINFETLDGQVRFDVSLRAAEEANLEISSRLLQLAIRVELLQRRRNSECPFGCHIGGPLYLLAFAELGIDRIIGVAHRRRKPEPVYRMPVEIESHRQAGRNVEIRQFINLPQAGEEIRILPQLKV